MPALKGFGRSFSVRFVNLMDNMNEEIRIAHEKLEELGKRAIWEMSQMKLQKDSLVISESRTATTAVLPPLSDCSVKNVAKIVNVLNRLFLARLSNILSGNIPEDFEKYSKAIHELIKNEKKSLVSDIWSYIIGKT